MPIVLYDPLFLEHDTGHHPECAERLVAIRRGLEGLRLWPSALPQCRDATLDEISSVHDPSYISTVQAMADRGGGFLDPDTVMSSRSYDAALRAAGALLTAADAIVHGRDTSALCLVRPPGHHARHAHGMGFCIFNNVAIAARHLQNQHKIRKIAIIDWDVHHGNGTQETFYEDNTVLYFSIHRYPFYPGTGSEDEVGAGEGTGFTVNRPVGYGISREQYLAIFRKVLEGPVSDFAPEFLIISSGFDAHRDDPISGLDLEASDFAEMTRLVRQVAERSAQGRILSALEGGYSLGTIPQCVAEHLQALA